MRMTSKLKLLPLIPLAALVSCAQQEDSSNDNVVSTIEEFDAAVAALDVEPRVQGTQQGGVLAGHEIDGRHADRRATR